MKYAIRALGWATAILWIFVMLFSGTLAYSAMQIGVNFEQDPEVTVSNYTMTMSIPFSISNGGYYDISNLDIATSIVAENEAVITSSTTLVPLISRGDTVSKTHDISVSLDDILAKNLTFMLLNDTDLNVDMLVALTYAHAIPLKISSNLTVPWGAPLSNLTIGEPTFTRQPPYRAEVPVSFENHAFFSLNGTLRLEIVERNDLIGWADESISVPSEDSYNSTILVTIDRIPRLVIEVRLYLNEIYLESWMLVIGLG